MKIFVSATGSDGASGTEGSSTNPYLTIAKGLSRLRNGSPDWLLLKEGDTWTNQNFGDFFLSGKSATEPMVFGSYDSANPTAFCPGTGGARPIIKPDPSGDNDGITSTSRGDYCAVIGLDFYQYHKDPANIGTTWDPDHNRGQGLNFGGSYNWLLVENCRFRFFQQNITIDATPGNSHHNTYVRRNLVVDAWGTRGLGSGIHAVQNYDNFLIEENTFDYNGWNKTLSDPYTFTVTIASPAVVSFSTIPFFNGTSIRFNDNGDTLPTGLAFNTEYFIVNYGTDGANKFRLSLTSGGADINTSGSQGGTHKLTWYAGADAASTYGPTRNSFNHDVYLDTDNDSVTLRGNLITRGSDVGFQGRCGGSAYNNFVAQNQLAGFITTLTDCVASEGVIGSTGFQIIAGNNATATGNIVSNSLLGASSGDAFDLGNSSDHDHAITFTVANPCVVTFTNRVKNNQAVQFTTTGTIPAHIPTATTLYIVNAGGSNPTFTANLATSIGGTPIDTTGDAAQNPSNGSGVTALYIAYNNSVTNNIVYNWGIPGNNIVDGATPPGFGNTITPNVDLASGGGTYPDPTRTAGSYAGTLALTATFDGFMNVARLQRKGNWSSALTANVLIDYIQTGFGIGNLRTFTCNFV